MTQGRERPLARACNRGCARSWSRRREDRSQPQRPWTTGTIREPSGLCRGPARSGACSRATAHPADGRSRRPHVGTGTPCAGARAYRERAPCPSRGRHGSVHPVLDQLLTAGCHVDPPGHVAGEAFQRTGADGDVGLWLPQPRTAPLDPPPQTHAKARVPGVHKRQGAASHGRRGGGESRTGRDVVRGSAVAPRMG